MERANEKPGEVTGDLIGNNIADKIKRSRFSKPKDSKTVVTWNGAGAKLPKDLKFHKKTDRNLKRKIHISSKTTKHYWWN